MKRTHIKHAVVRHTKSGDKIEGLEDSPHVAHQLAADIATQSAADYGYGSTSVYRAKVVLLGKPQVGR